MRSSSVKTLVVTVSLFAVVSAAAVTAEARPARPSSRTTVSSPRKNDSAYNRAVATLKALQKRVFIVIGHIMVQPPLPDPEPTATVNNMDPIQTVD